MILDELKIHAVRQRREAARLRKEGKEAEADHAEQRAEMADRGVLLMRPGVEVGGDGKFLHAHRDLYDAARKAGLVASDLDDDLRPPPAPRIPPSPSAGWSEDGKVYRVWQSDWDRPGFRTRDGAAYAAQAKGAEIEVIPDIEPGQPFRATFAQMRDPHWVMANRRQRDAALRAKAFEVVDDPLESGDLLAAANGPAAGA